MLVLKICPHIECNYFYPHDQKKSSNEEPIHHTNTYKIPIKIVKMCISVKKLNPNKTEELDKVRPQRYPISIFFGNKPFKSE